MFAASLLRRAVVLCTLSYVKPSCRRRGSASSLQCRISAMVEGHSVHRVARLHRQRLVGKAFKATSPNGRFSTGARLIDGVEFSRIEAVGKNLFCFFGATVVHVHFGMAGNWAVYGKNEEAPAPTKTNRLRLVAPGIVADLSAMTVQHGGMELYESKRAKLGEDPLRDDADPERLWLRVKTSKKSIGALIMDQSYFTGPGNIYRAEILFKAGVHPNMLGKDLTKAQFDTVWEHTVALLERGFQTGSILTVDPEEAAALGTPDLRRYIYNAAKCPRCASSIRTWSINNRTCYACPTCQPLPARSTSVSPAAATAAAVTPTDEKVYVPFNSHCARESVRKRLLETGPARLSVQEIKIELKTRGETIPSKCTRKSDLMELLQSSLEREQGAAAAPPPPIVSSEAAALEKARAGESLAVEHVAELGPVQARRVRAKAAGSAAIAAGVKLVK